MNERISVHADVSNLYFCVNKKFNAKINYDKYLKRIIEGNDGNNNNILYRAIAYGAQLNDEATKFIDCLRAYGYQPKYKRPKEFENPEYHIDLSALEMIVAESINSNGAKELAESTINNLRKVLRSRKDIRKADWDVSIAIDIVRMIDRVDTIVLGSADSDFAPLIEWVRDRGCRCIVYACNISKELRDVADFSIEIGEDILEERKNERFIEQSTVPR